MNPGDFISVAEELAKGKREAHRRSAISRAYYAVFHEAKQALQTKRNEYVPKNSNAHAHVQTWLINQQDNTLSALGSDIGNLHSQRLRADYNIDELIIDKNDEMLALSLARILIQGIKKNV